MKRRMGPLLKGIYLFAGSNLFKKLRFNPSVRQLVQYGVLDLMVWYSIKRSTRLSAIWRPWIT